MGVFSVSFYLSWFLFRVVSLTRNPGQESKPFLVSVELVGGILSSK